MAGDHILKGAQGVMSVVFSAGYSDPDPVTVVVKDANGADVVTSADAVRDPNVPGRYYKAVPPQAEVMDLTATWSGTFGGVVQSAETYAEVVGHLLFTIAEARGYGDRQLNDVNAYPDAVISQARTRITDEFANCCMVQFIPRYGRDVIDGHGGNQLFLGNGYARRVDHVISAKVDGSAVDPSGLVIYPNGKLIRRSGAWPAGLQNIVVEYDHGYRIPPLEVPRAAMVWTVFELGSHEVPDRVLTFTTDQGTIVRMAQPGTGEVPRQRPTGIPYVDAIIGRYDETAPILGVA